MSPTLPTVLPYDESSLALVLSNTYTLPEVIAEKKHFLYLRDYLGGNGMMAQTIVVEDDYISKDFLHDYASYYSLCFEKYPKVCTRVHFFKNVFSEIDFHKVILGKEIDNLEFWENYIGFVVVKPIPVTVIGYTVLKTYPDSPQGSIERNFWGVREYKVHFYGNEIIIKSLAFQEQDSVLAACATSAIWSMLNKAATDFHTTLKSPSQITKDADTVSPDGSRLFPNKGLSVLQICQAILNSGLVSEVKKPDFKIEVSKDKIIPVVSNSYLKKILNAYSPIGIPIILVINVPNGSLYGLHAVTITGYKQGNPKPLPPTGKIGWISEAIEKFYAHDDQWGPFARVHFMGDCELETTWTKFNPNNLPTFITNIIVPIYPKIRISYEDIEVIVLGLDRIFTHFFGQKIKTDLAWDVKVDYSESYKSRVKQLKNISESEKLAILKRSQPKYLWIVSCYVGEHRILKFTFDATGVSNGMMGKDVICFMSNEFRDELREYLLLHKDVYQKLFKHRASISYYDFLIKELK